LIYFPCRLGRANIGDSEKTHFSTWSASWSAKFLEYVKLDLCKFFFFAQWMIIPNRFDCGLDLVGDSKFFWLGSLPFTSQGLESPWYPQNRKLDGRLGPSNWSNQFMIGGILLFGLNPKGNCFYHSLLQLVSSLSGHCWFICRDDLVALILFHVSMRWYLDSDWNLKELDHRIYMFVLWFESLLDLGKIPVIFVFPKVHYDYTTPLLKSHRNTPVIRLNKVCHKGNQRAKFLVKVEYFTQVIHERSNGDQNGWRMLKSGIAQVQGGTITRDKWNTRNGVWLCAITKGLQVIFTMAVAIKEKIDILKAVGAEVIVCQQTFLQKIQRSYYSLLRTWCRYPYSSLPNQYVTFPTP